MRANNVCTFYVLLSASFAFADPQFVYKEVGHDGKSRVVDPNQGVGTASATRNYDNHYPSIFGGQTVLTGSAFVGFDEIGDDLNLVGSIGVLDTIGFNVSNRSQVSGFGVGRFTLRVRDRSSGSQVGQVSFQFDLDMPANTGAFFELPQGIFAQANIVLSSQVWLTMQWDFIQGANQPTDIKTFYGAPQAIGSSSSIIRNFTTGVESDLGGGNLPNSFMWYVATSPVPAPGATALCIIAAGTASRRRR
jgi:hypothetical protein